MTEINHFPVMPEHAPRNGNAAPESTGTAHKAGKKIIPNNTTLDLFGQDAPATTAILATAAPTQTPPPAPCAMHGQTAIEQLREAIPREMLVAKRWLVWRSEENPNPSKKPRKVPYYANGGRRSGVLDSPTDRAAFASFERAVSVMEFGKFTGLGFALGPDGTQNVWQGIDFDDIPNRPMLQSLQDDLPGYTEESPSGRGMHAIGYGRVFGPLGSNSTGIEAYSHGRFFTITGIGAGIHPPTCLSAFVESRLKPLHGVTVSASPINSEIIATPPQSPIYVPPETVADLRSALCFLDSDDRDVWVSIGHALKTIGNSGKGKGLFFEWSQKSDKYDPGFIEKEWRGFQPNATHYKKVFKAAQKAGWVNPLSNAAGSKPLGGKQTMADYGVLESIPVQKEPVAASKRVPFDLPTPPGLAGEISDYIFKSSRNPVHSFACAGALQVIAHLNANRRYVRASDTALNLYQCLIGGTASGKEDPRKAFKRLADSRTSQNLVIIPPSIAEGAASGPALVRTLVDNPNITILSDEFGLFLQAALSDRAPMHLRELIKELLSFFGLGRSYYGGKPYADSKYSIQRIDLPYVNILGTTTPLELVEGVSEKAIDNGFLNRILMVQASEANPINREPDHTVPKSLIDALNLLGCEPGGIEYEPGAHDYMIVCADEMLARLKKKGDKYANLWGRAEEQMIRVAGVLAIGGGGTITREHLAWAYKYVSWSIKSFADFLGTDLTETVFQKNLKKAIAIVNNARHYSDDKKYAAICKKGAMPKSKLLSLMRMSARDMDDIYKYFSETETFSTSVFEGVMILHTAENSIG